jgi:hypothetical protein
LIEKLWKNIKHPQLSKIIMLLTCRSLWHGTDAILSILGTFYLLILPIRLIKYKNFLKSSNFQQYVFCKETILLQEDYFHKNLIKVTLFLLILILFFFKLNYMLWSNQSYSFYKMDKSLQSKLGRLNMLSF